MTSVSLPVTARVTLLTDSRADMRPPVQGDAARLVNHLVSDDHEPGNLENLVPML
jgi:hypothetical protein